MLSRLNHSSMWSLAGGIVPALAALGSVPVFIYIVGAERFAILSLLFSINLFFFVYDFGFARAMHFFLPKDKYKCNEQEKRLTSASLTLAFFIGGVISLFIFFLSPFLVEYWLNVGSDNSSEMILAFQIAGGGVLPAIMMSVLRGRFEGAGDFKQANVAKIFSGTSLFLLPLLAAIYNDSLILLALTITISRFLAFFVYIKLSQNINFNSFIKIDFSLVSKIKHYVFWAAISGFFSTAFIYADRFFVAGFVSSYELSIYVASQDILSRYLIIPWSIAIVLTPYFASDQFNYSDFRDIQARALKKIFLLTSLFVLAVIMIIFWLLPLWIQVNSYFLINSISLILLCGVVFASLAQLPLVVLYAQGKAKLLSFIFLSEAILYLCFAPLLYKKFGIYAAASVWSARLFIEMTALYVASYRMMQNK
ncbi:MAG TPA: hypothetical protein EYM37_13265 [Methylophaga aminisulfidivorans]|uniref:oligosaccharide flippase family protein n=2 Tax=Piscirickettsiaceae TaxID=135616 RepID=UPI00176BCE15|nr:hypothetical protein [Methylophaga sp.]HIM40884.1 hypothetical protein [Methylophaga aminisulfidivorans]